MLTFPRFAVSAAKPAPRLFASANLRRYFPGWGIPCSLAVHEVALVVLLLWSVLHIPREPFQPPERAAPPKRREMTVTMMYFPPLAPGNRRPAGKAEAAGELPSQKPVTKTKTGGLIYPGPQEMVSDPAKPTNQVQTIIQPDLIDPPDLEPPPALPNMLLMADAAPVQKPTFQEPPLQVPVPVTVEDEPSSIQSDPPEIKPEPPPVTTEVPPLVDRLAPVVPDPVLPLPPPPAAAPALVPLPAPDVPPRKDETPVEAPKVEAPPKETETPKQPPAPRVAAEPASGENARNFLAISPMPAVPTGPIELPSGQAQARFAISPKPNLAVREAEPPSTLGDPSAAPFPPKAAAVPGGENLLGNPPKAVTVSLGGPGSGKNRGSSGDALSTSPTAGSGAGTGSGSSPVAGPGTSPFAGITVVGRGGATGQAAGPVVRIRPARPLQTSYGVTVVSTESSGGGLPFSGVFAGRQIHTVYLDMRQSETDSAPSWTLEFALPRKMAVRADSTQGKDGSRQGVVLPFPTVKGPLLLPSELVLKHLRETIIVYGVINVEGKMEQISVMKSPDALLNEPVLEGLSKWVFRPASLEGAAVAVELLLGIPLWSPPNQAVRTSTE